MPFNHKANLASCLESLRKSIVPRWDKYFADKTTNTGFDFYHSDSPAVQLDFIQCPFPNQIQFGLEKIHPKNASDFPNQFQFGLERKNGILQDADSKPNSDWFGKNWWPLSTSWKFQTKFSLVWNNHWLLSTPWTFNQSQFYCSSQPSMVHWLSISIFPFSFVRLFVHPPMVTPDHISTCPRPRKKAYFHDQYGVMILIFGFSDIFHHNLSINVLI